MLNRITVTCQRCARPTTIIVPAFCDSLTCESCAVPFDGIQIVPLDGFIYILSNVSMPGLFKIGSTERNVCDWGSGSLQARSMVGLHRTSPEGKDRALAARAASNGQPGVLSSELGHSGRGCDSCDRTTPRTCVTGRYRRPDNLVRRRIRLQRLMCGPMCGQVIRRRLSRNGVS
jgi:hypothetical protein